MEYLLSGRQMSAADKYTIEHVGIPSMVLMERAALEAVKIMEEEAVSFERVLVVCGSGNNGGDGYAIARLLHLKGHDVTICFVGNSQHRSTENAMQKQITEYYHIPAKQEIGNEEYSVIIDAVFGTGLSREISGDYARIIKQLNAMKGYKIAIDSPSGIHDETGDVLGIAFEADLTIAIAFVKRGHVIAAGNPYVGKLRVADIGIYMDAVPLGETLTYCYDFKDFSMRFPRRVANSHKGTYGKVLVIAGSKGMSGAAILCARAAYETGAGLVQIYTHEDNRIIIQKSLPEAIVTTYTSFDEMQLLSLLDWADVVGIGCGLGQSEVAEQLVKKVLAYAEIPCVIDADALNLISKDSSILRGVKQDVILTPHLKEMSRLLNCDMQELQNNKIELLEAFVKQYHLVCVLKDARTLVGCNTKNMFLNLTGNSAMAKGGSGDVLTGIISGILAQKTEAYDAACLGVYLHGMAGDYARDRKGQYSVLAGDIVESIGEILKRI